MDSPRTALTTSHDVLGARVKCWTYPAAGPSRGTILAVHGFRGDHHGLQRIVDALPGYTIVVPDLPGFGASSPLVGTAHDVAGYARAVDALRVELGVPGDAVLLGHSFGSLVASALLATHPGAFSRLVLLNPICEPALEGGNALMSRGASLFYAAGAVLPAGPGDALLRSRAVTDLMSRAMTKSSDPGVRAYVKDQHRRYFGRFSDRATLREAFEASISGTVGQYAAAIGVPVLLVAGALDELGSVAGQEALAARFPEARLTVLPGVGHLVHYETAAAAAAAVDGFLAATAPLPGRPGR
ncbi:alpha/beta fold hydrolase [Zafaria sp. Z1313]|uniref:alpha/beta fold hydrolase n=1 Tax=unclassified Zafaria TaxID=2828765 RepID=UPI002E76F320|nr:alpha/beta hydrolase [Zafaria sp. J156]MEE1621141.1 alpha/beta hydrolase [Zafaria sp. J156]